MNKLNIAFALLFSLVFNVVGAQETRGYASLFVNELLDHHFVVASQGYEGNSYVVKMHTPKVLDEDLAKVAINSVVIKNQEIKKNEKWVRRGGLIRSSYLIGDAAIVITVLQLPEDADGFSQGCVVKIHESSASFKPKHKAPKRKKKFHRPPKRGKNNPH